MERCLEFPDVDKGALVSEQANGNRWRLQNHEDRLKWLEQRTANVNVMERDIRNLERALTDLREEMSNLRKALYTAALSFAGGALLVAATMFQVLQ